MRWYLPLHPYFANTAVLEAGRKYGIAVEAHSPLGHNNAELDDATIQQIADAHGRSVAQIILRWHMHHSHIAIPKSARPQRMAENLDVFDFELTPELLSAIDNLDKGETRTDRAQPRHLRRRLTRHASGCAVLPHPP